MILKKIRKHLSITQTRLNQQKELKKIASYQNDTLKKVVESILTVRTIDFTAEDKQAFANCENYRTQLLENETLISYEIFGSNETAKVQDICKNAASGKKWCELLYYLAKNTNSPSILEIGTNLGISGCYALEAIKNKSEARFVTMEGLSQLCEISSRQFALVDSVSKYDVREGLFDSTFPKLVKEDIYFNLIFIDGNHKKEPTIAYFEALKMKVKSPVIFVFDDINWSKGMKNAWEVIKNDENVNFTIDLYKQGIVILDQQESTRNIEFKLHLAY